MKVVCYRKGASLAILCWDDHANKLYFTFSRKLFTAGTALTQSITCSSQAEVSIISQYLLDCLYKTDEYLSSPPLPHRYNQVPILQLSRNHCLPLFVETFYWH